MEFYYKKFKLLRKEARWTMKALADKCSLTRQTLSLWERGKLTPPENRIIQLAKILSVPISNISNLKDDIPVSPKNISPTINNLLSLANQNHNNISNKRNSFIQQIYALFKEQEQISVLVKALINSTQSFFYMKDKELKYIIANKSFLKNLSLNDDYNVIGKTDFDFFPKKEAEENFSCDSNVLKTGKAIVNKEGYILGSRKKKYGRMSKYPVYEGDEIIGVLCNIVDVTKQKELEFIQQLIIDSLNRIDVNVGIYDLNAKEFIYSTNLQENIFGVNPSFKSDVLFDCWINEIVHPDDREEQRKLLNNFDSLPEERTYRIVHPQKGIRTIKAISVKMPSLFNRQFMVSLSIDITDKSDEQARKQ